MTDPSRIKLSHLQRAAYVYIRQSTPDEAVTGAVRTVFERFAEFGSARRVWLWFRSEGLLFPLQIMPAGLPGPVR